MEVPCRGLLVPADEAVRALTCLRVDLPELEELSAIREAELEAELRAERERTEAALRKAASYRELLDDVSAPRPPGSSTWRIVAGVAGTVLAVAGGLVAGLEHEREEVLIPAIVIGSAGLALGIVAAIDP